MIQKIKKKTKKNEKKNGKTKENLSNAFIKIASRIYVNF